MDTTPTTTVLADDGLLQVVFSYLPQSYRFVALVSKSFHRNYLEAYGGEIETSNANALQKPTTAQIWLRENPLNEHRPPCDVAAEVGTLEVLQFLWSNGCPWSPQTCSAAAARGYLEMLKWARENGCGWDEYTCKAAAENGYMEILKWARENGCPWNASTCEAAAGNGDLEMLKWARANDCPWDLSTAAAAARNEHLEILRWIWKI